MSVVGRLRALLSLESATYIADAGKARKVTRDLETDMGGLTAKVRGLGPSLAGATQATSAAAQALKLVGSQASAAVTGLSNALVSLLAGGFTPIGIAVAAVTAGIALFTSGEKEAAAASDETSRAIEKHAAALRQLRTEQELLRQGKGASAAEIEIRDAERALAGLRNQLFEAGAGRAMSAPLSETERSIKAQVAEQERLIASLVETVALTKENAALRKGSAGAAERETVAVERQVAAVRAIAEVTRTDPLASLRSRMSTLRGELARISAGDVDPLEAQRARVRAAEAQVRGVVTNRRDPNFQPLTEEQQALVEVLALERRYLVEIEREVALRRHAQQATEAQARAVAAAAAAAKKVEEESGDRNAAREAREAVAREVLDVERDLRFSIEQMDRDVTEARVAETQRRYDELLASAKAYGIEVVELEKLIAEEIRRVRAGAAGGAAGAPPPASTDKKLAPGFESTIAGIGDVDAALVKLGETAAIASSHGIASVLEDIVRNSKSAEEAFREFVSSLAFEVGRMMTATMIARGIMSIFPGTFGSVGADAGAGAAAAAAPTGAAFGGTWKVGGYGGLDSQLVRMKLSPGELVKVSRGAGSGGDVGPIDVTVVNRPAPVFADEVAARMSSAARAGVVATAVRRPGYRAGRAME